MGTKKEIYYRFIFPDYASLTGSDSASYRTSDGTNQNGEVRALCRKCPERVITYDQLAATSPISMYADVWDNSNTRPQPYSRSFIKSCIDKYLTIPKYFNLRNYWDSNVCQEGGMSLMVSDSPEVGGDYSSYTKFTVGTKTVYCAVMASSGDFFYNFCLPEEVLAKSGLADAVVKPAQFIGKDGNKTPLLRFHSNWCLNGPEKSALQTAHIINAQVGQEKRIFVQAYFYDNYAYGVQNNDKNSFYYVNFKDNSGNTYNPFDENLHCVDILGKNVSENGTRYTGSYKNFPPNEFVRYYYINEDTTANRVTRQTFTSKVGNSELLRVVENASTCPYIEDLKGDFISLEVTRRILFYDGDNGNQLKYNGVSRTIHPTSDIPRYISGSGKTTKLSYEPPDEYIDDAYIYKYKNYSSDDTSVTVRGTPPLQIPYNYLRYALNDRPPFTDCETVLVMWVANSDPKYVSDGDVATLHSLDWQQYAIPISVRCCFKKSTERDSCSTPHKHIHDRFIVDFPKWWSLVKTESGSYIKDQSQLVYRYHTRRSESYNKLATDDNVKFREVLYLQDLVQYSNDYVIVYQNSNYLNKGFDTQGYLLSKYSDAFKKLYCLKTYMDPVPVQSPTYNQNARGASNNQNGQFYYIRVNNSAFSIKTDDYSITNRKICFRKLNSTVQYVPSNDIYRLNVSNYKWDPHGSVAPSTKVRINGTIRDWSFDDITYYNVYGYNDWKIDDTRFIALFDANYTSEGSPIFHKLAGVSLSLKKTDGNTLRQRLGNWDEFYISSIGVSLYNPINIDSIFRGGDCSGSFVITYPLGVLDGFIVLGGTTYGSSINGKVVAGFANMLDFNQNDLYHFKWNGSYYIPIKRTVTYGSTTLSVSNSPASFTCTAYVIDYT